MLRPITAMHTPYQTVRMFHVKHLVLLLALTATLLHTAGCVVQRNPVTGRNRAYGMTWEQEKQLGQQADQQIIAQYGLYDDPELSAYVNRVAERVLAQSRIRRPEAPAEYRNTAFTFRVLDSPVVNAFALPGGYVYVTRGLLSHLENEAQLAVVLGHEIGHVEARHASQRQFEQQLGQLGVLGGAIIGQEVLGLPADQILNAAGTAAQLLFLKYGRDDERESDKLGVEYAAMAGYEAGDAADFFRTLSRIGEQQGQEIPSFLSTHPDPGEREQTIQRMAQEWETRAQMEREGQQELYAALDGIIVGEDPRQGYVENGTFYHPGMRFRFAVPRGYQLINQPQQVVMVEPNQQAILVFSLAQQKTAQEAARAFASQQGMQVVENNAARRGNLNAYYVVADAQTQEGQVFRILSYYVEYGGNVYNFLGYTAQQLFTTHQQAFRQAIEGFAPETNPAVLNVQPVRLDIREAPRAAPFRTLAQQAQLPRDFDLQDLAILNQVEVETQIPQGYALKLTTQ